MAVRGALKLYQLTEPISQLDVIIFYGQNF